MPAVVQKNKFLTDKLRVCCCVSGQIRSQESSPATACAQSARKPLGHLVTVLLDGSFVGHSAFLCYCKRTQSVQFSIFEEN